MNKKQLKHFKKLLEKEKKQIIKELKGFAKQDKKIRGNWRTIFPLFGFHRSEQDENINEVERYESLLPVEHTLELRLKDIEDALEKIKKGKYGFCERCGQPISLKRLEVYPEARLCLKCFKK